jgi:hypothetical protein
MSPSLFNLKDQNKIPRQFRGHAVNVVRYSKDSKSNSKSNSKSGIVMSPSKSTSAYSAGLLCWPACKEAKEAKGENSTIPQQGWHPLCDHPDEQDEASSSVVGAFIGSRNVCFNLVSHLHFRTASLA